MNIQSIIKEIFNEEKEIYSTVEIGKKLGLSSQSIIKQITNGNLTAFKIGKVYRIAKYNLIEFLEKNVL